MISQYLNFALYLKREDLDVGYLFPLFIFLSPRVKNKEIQIPYFYNII